VYDIAESLNRASRIAHRALQEGYFCAQSNFEFKARFSKIRGLEAAFVATGVLVLALGRARRLQREVQM
jgi:hypothetical protein